jgi:hypothetical protein
MAHTTTNAFLASDLPTWDRLISALTSSDLGTLSHLLATGNLVALAAGTSLVVDEDLATLARVRVLDGPASGRHGLLVTRALQHTAQAA